MSISNKHASIKGMPNIADEENRASKETEAAGAELAERSGASSDSDLEEKAAKKAKEGATQQHLLEPTEPQTEPREGQDATKGKGKTALARDAAHPYVQA